ncbi:coenzyme synthetase [Myxococcus llanfairpwllgwyngyllgogerychwyrndrobwllllantysiliogogogochensis]|uniref:Coenzyme synthetase n=1 Tax=Myxococcus llanfairpwllgwyngyllgogerychwyrndrobwllllantysiliogogogochensis TaxID=2590453 RepID=A0A540X7L7_9BACT|nr:coenzyme synthetase [Myxococcus llanfairpwllgwyngyllgogerychwyrndrobwllllantysiliogogogochensis]TQF17182.1 coenzyme synthetase [Myxococcus llanfairpwllgwyngyllgogerychwyrndrobwllllantysiliogogogochensis]
MARVTLGLPSDARVAPRANIRRDTATQRPHVPWAESIARDLSRFAVLPDEAAARAELESRLEGLRAGLLASPYYTRRLRDAGLHPGDLRTLADLRHFPTLERGTLARHWDQVPTPLSHEDESVVVRSSGSTGEPVKVVRDRRDCLHMWAVLRFWLERARAVLPPRPRVVLLDALPGGLEYSVRLPILQDGALHRISVLRDNARERLSRVRPAVIFSDPEGLRWLSEQRDLPAPALLLTSAQYLPQDTRDALARSVPAPLLNYYATTETGPLAWECLGGPGRFHVLAPDVWLEPGLNEVVVTRLRPSVLPLLRYLPGDSGTVDRDACACGFHGWTLERFGGRGACHFTTPTGRTVDAWTLAWVFKHHALRAFRLTQLTPSSFELELAGADASEVTPLCERLVAALRNLGWSGSPRLDVRHVSAEDLATGTKPLPFRSRARVP